MKRTILAFVLLLGAFAALSAQTVKLGFVDTERIMMESNEIAEISRLFNLDKNNWTSQIKQLDAEIKQMERDFEIDKLTKTEAAKRDAQTRIDEKKAEAGRLLEEYFGEGGKAEQRYLELTDPVTQKINNIIKKIAEDEKYTMIFDVSMGTILYAAPSVDLTDQILLELNKDTIPPTDQTLPPEGEIKAPEDITKPGEFGDEFKPDFKP